MNKNRIGELHDKNDEKANPGDTFVAFEVQIESNDDKKVETYKRIDGIFLRLEDSSENSLKDILVYQKQNDNNDKEEKKIPVRKLRTFKKQSSTNE